ncbi:MAG: type IV pilin protein [Elusimicrobiales bacterium]
MKKRGFTLVELMIVIVIIGILAAVAIPKFADMVDKSKEGATKAQLQSLRGALSVYYGDNEGKYPQTATTATPTSTTVLADNLIPKYVSQIGVAKLPIKNANHTCNPESATVYAVLIPTTNADNSGGWAYDGLNTSNTWGDLRVNCNGADLKGTAWTSY